MSFRGSLLTELDIHIIHQFCSTYNKGIKNARLFSNGAALRVHMFKTNLSAKYDIRIMEIKVVILLFIENTRNSSQKKKKTSLIQQLYARRSHRVHAGNSVARF